MNASNHVQLAFRVAISAALFVFVSACGDPRAQAADKAQLALTQWFQAAAQGDRADTLCHGYGALKHPDVTCAQMLEHAAAVDPASRQVTNIEPMECFSSVCGDFHQIELDSLDTNGAAVREQAIVKQDEGKYRLYWYRSDTILAEIRTANAKIEGDAKDPIQVAYDQITERYPALYEFPPCLGVRVSSSNLVGELMPKDAINVATIEALATQCGEEFCFALVGQKIAPVCPAR